AIRAAEFDRMASLDPTQVIFKLVTILKRIEGSREIAAKARELAWFNNQRCAVGRDRFGEGFVARRELHARYVDDVRAEIVRPAEKRRVIARRQRVGAVRRNPVAGLQLSIEVTLIRKAPGDRIAGAQQVINLCDP